MMLRLVILSNILLGSYSTLKMTVIFGAYDVLGRIYDYSALADEQTGGIIIWIPSSMMCLIAILIVIHQLGLDERHIAYPIYNSSVLLYPTTGAGLIERYRSKNQAMVIGLGVFAITVFAVAFLIDVLYEAPEPIGTTLTAGNKPMQHTAHEPFVRLCGS